MAAGRYATAGGHGVSGVDRLAADLAAASANLDAWVEARAGELAAARIADAEAIAAGRVAAIEQAWAAERRRHEDVMVEMRRIIGSLDRFQQQHVRGRCTPTRQG